MQSCRDGAEIMKQVSVMVTCVRRRQNLMIEGIDSTVTDNTDT